MSVATIRKNAFVRKVPMGLALVFGVLAPLLFWDPVRWVVMPAAWLVVALELLNVSRWHAQFWDRYPKRARDVLPVPKKPGGSARTLPGFLLITNGLAVGMIWLRASWQITLVLLANAVLSDVFAQASGMASKWLKAKLGLKPPRAFSADSPSKTWAGVIGGVVGGALAGIAMSMYMEVRFGLGVPTYLYPLLAVGPAFAVMGDLYESRLKREVGVKDLSRFLGAHGGLVDRLDSLGAYLATIGLTVYGFMAGPIWLVPLLVGYDLLIVGILATPRKE